MSRTSRPRLLLIGPTALDGGGRPIRQSRIHLPGLTLPMLAAVTPTHWEVRILNETVEDVPYGEPWDVVGLTGMGSGLVGAWRIADEFRRRRVTVVIGGIAASLMGADLSLAHADAVVLGEAEETWPVVLADAEAGRLQPVYTMARRPPIETLPLPRYDLLKARHYGLWRPVQATRGCPFTCDFCSITTYFEQRYRKRPVDQVIRDVRAAKRHGTRYIAFIDDNIGVDWDYCTQLWEALIPEKIRWMSQCSLHIADHAEMLKLAHRSGCRLLSFGVETTSEASLAEHGKAWNRPARYGEAIASIRRHGIEVSTEMIIGMDGDSDTVFESTYSFIMDNRIAVPRVHIMTPIPGTPLHRRLAGEDRLVPVEYEQYTGGTVTFRPRHIDAARLQAEYWRLYRRLFTWRAILHRVGRNPARIGPYMRAVVMGVNLHYRSHIHHRITPGLV
jgi:radical SAM superfamily enzyme YgiQ (UPF0313 family)